MSCSCVPLAFQTQEMLAASNAAVYTGTQPWDYTTKAGHTKGAAPTFAAGAGECSSRESDTADATNSRSVPSDAAPVDAGPEPAFATCNHHASQWMLHQRAKRGAMQDVHGRSMRIN